MIIIKRITLIVNLFIKLDSLHEYLPSVLFDNHTMIEVINLYNVLYSRVDVHCTCMVCVTCV